MSTKMYQRAASSSMQTSNLDNSEEIEARYKEGLSFRLQLLEHQALVSRLQDWREEGAKKIPSLPADFSFAAEITMKKVSIKWRRSRREAMPRTILQKPRQAFLTNSAERLGKLSFTRGLANPRTCLVFATLAWQTTNLQWSKITTETEDCHRYSSFIVSFICV